MPGRSMVVRDLLNASDPVTVREKNATRSLKPWDRIAVRVVKLGDNQVISGALLQFSSEAAELLLDSLRHTLGLGPRQTLTLREDQKRGCAPLFANAWLFTQLPSVLAPELPTLTNSNGDPLEFHDLRFPFAAGVLQRDVKSSLARHPELLSAGLKAWSWVTTKPAPSGGPKGALAMHTSKGGQTVLGYLELKDKALILSVNSAERAEIGRAMLMSALDGLVKAPLTSIRAVEQAMAEHQEAPSGEVPPDVDRQIVHENLDRHYRETLDKPVPALAERTPRQAARSVAGRK